MDAHMFLGLLDLAGVLFCAWCFNTIVDKLENLMTTAAEILASQDAEDAEIKTIIAALQSSQASVTQLQSTVAALQAQVAAGSPATQADLDAIAAKIAAQKAEIDAALAPVAPAAPTA